MQMDVRDMSVFPDDSFGSVIDKGNFSHIWKYDYAAVFSGWVT